MDNQEYDLFMRNQRMQNIKKWNKVREQVDNQPLRLRNYDPTNDRYLDQPSQRLSQDHIDTYIQMQRLYSKSSTAVKDATCVDDLLTMSLYFTDPEYNSFLPTAEMRQKYVSIQRNLLDHLKDKTNKLAQGLMTIIQQYMIADMHENEENR